VAFVPMSRNFVLVKIGEVAMGALHRLELVQLELGGVDRGRVGENRVVGGRMLADKVISKDRSGFEVAFTSKTKKKVKM
jgi:hypothetical protein